MTSFMRYFFGGSHSSSHSRSQESSTRTTPRSSTSTSSSAYSGYVYCKAPSNGTSSSQRLKTKRSNSYCARTSTPSPLRYATFEAAGHGTTAPPPRASSSYSSRPSMYRRASYKSAEKTKTYPLQTPCFGSSSRNNSNTSLAQGYFPPPPPSSTGSHNSVRYNERRPPLNKTHTWQSSVSSAGSSRSYGSMDPQSHVRPVQTGAGVMHMHPIFASSRLHSAPLSYDITFTPSARTVLDRSTHTAVPAHTLNQPCTDPPTSSMSRIVLRSDKFPWPVVVAPSKGGGNHSSSAGSQPGSGFYTGSSPSKSAGRSSYITNMDLLYAVHTTLLQRVTPAEWEALGHGSRAQRKATRAYENRCTRMGGGWEGGVRRIDWLHGKTRLVGVEVEKGFAGTSTGRLLFGKP